jgi:hypothetical protein
MKATTSKKNKNECDEILTLLEKFDLLQIDKQIIDAAILVFYASDLYENREEQFLTYLLDKIKGGTEKEFRLREILESLHVNKSDQKVTKKKEWQELKTEEKPEQEKSTIKDIEKKEEISEAIYISNSGLILLHPFLQTLFGNLGLTRDNVWIDRYSQETAILVTVYLVQGRDVFEEFNVMLNKILCGFNPDEIVVAELPLNDKIKEECAVLLNEVISQWNILKNTSIDGLRETFLQRNGKLIKVDNGWLLQVEHKAVDILLNHLPWGIGSIKLPWMKEILFTEWT